MKKFLLLLGIVSTLTMGAYQMIPEQVGVGSSKPDASASLHLTGVTKGFIPNKLTTAQRNAIPSPANGLMIYNTNLDELQLYNGVGWITVGAGGAGGVDAWATATVYAVDDVVIFNQELYLCQNNHTSGVFATDLANGDWLIISDDVSSTGTITDTAIPRFVGTSGNVIDSSGVTIDASNNVAGAASLAIGGSLNASSILDTVSTTKGTRPCPSMSEVQRDAIVTPATGLCVYNTDTNTLNVYNGSAWVSAGGGISLWATAKSYKIDDVVIESDRIYRALVNHTSGTFATDLAANRWTEVSGMQIVGLATGVTGILPTANGGTGSSDLGSGVVKASSGALSAGTVDLTSDVNGILPIANGGTGSATQNFVDLTTNQTVAGEKTFSNTLKSDSIQTTGSSGVVIKNSSGATVADFGPANTTNASIAGGLNTGGNISATGTVTGSNLSGTNTGDLLGQGQSEGSASTITTLEAPLDQLTTTDTNKRLIETGNDNVIKDPGFEGNSLQWVTYADAAGTAPVDGTGGTANITAAYTSTSPLNGKKSMLFTKDAANRQGQGTSLNFTIPDINKGKVNNIKISYDIVSGTYATGDLTMWVINVDPASVTNGRVIQPSAYTIENSGLKESKFLEFQSDIDSNLYRLVIHVTSTSNNAYSLRFDDVSVGLGPKIFGSVTTDWVSYTPTFQGYGTPTSVEFQWRRNGGNVEIRGKFTAGTPTAVEARIGLPSGLVSAGTSIIPSIQPVGTMYSTSSTSATIVYVPLVEPSVSYLTYSYVQGATQLPYTKRNGSDVFNSGFVISVQASIPIQGWSSSQQLSNDADTRVVSFNAASVSPVVITNANAGVTKLVFTSVYDDSHGSYNASTGEYTVKVPGVYQVYAKTFITMASGMQNLAVYKNSGRGAYGTTAYGAATVESDVSWQGKVVVGDVISIRTFQTSGSGTATVGNASSTGDIFFIAKLSGPSQIAASDSVSFSANTSTTAATTSAPFIYTVKDHDSHGAYSTSTGKFTAPMSGKYSCSAGYYSASINVIAYLYKNTSAIFYGTPATAGSNPGAVQGVVSLLQGETVEVRPSSSATAGGGATLNYFSCIRVGN